MIILNYVIKLFWNRKDSIMSFFQYMKNKILSIKNDVTNEFIGSEFIENDPVPLKSSLLENMIALRSQSQDSADFLVREITVANIPINFLMTEGMVNLQTMSEMLIEPLLNENFELNTTKEDILSFIHSKSILAADMTEVYNCEEVFKFTMSGFVVILIDGFAKGIAFGLQGFNFRSITEPSSEINERGAREGFTEPLRINMTMVRRRVKSPKLHFELMSLGVTSKTDICLMYMSDKVSPQLLRNLKHRLKNIKLEVIITSGSLQPFLEGKPWSLFSDVGVTERPDVLCAKINEGRVAIVVDGTPFALIVPYLFSENFQSLDDYANKAYYATFIRIMKYIAFFISIFLPGMYVAIGTFHPGLFPHSLLFNIAAAEEITPFPLFLESLLIHLIYEIMREAGLRLPRPIGHAVSIVGALVIGDAAVTAGLIGAPMIMVVALTAISSFVVPSLYEVSAFLRFAFIFLGGIMGLYGITIASLVILVNMCTLNNFGVPYLTPIAPFSLIGIRDTFIRVGYKILHRKNIKIQNLKGTQIDTKDDL